MSHVAIKSWLFLLLLCDVTSNPIISLCLTLRRFLWEGEYSDALTVPIEVDGQSLNVFVDTGAPQTFVISNNTLYNDEACDGCIYGLYECRQPSCDKQVKKVAFLDGRKTDIIDHKGNIKLGAHMVTSVDFGIVRNYTALGRSPHSSLGLGLADYSGDFVPILDQLVTKGVIENKELSIYFNPDNINEGELLLGGGDPNKYYGELMPVPLTDEYEWTVKLGNIKIDGTSILEAPYSMLFDTGTSLLAAPLEVLDTIIGHIEKSVRNAGQEIVWHWKNLVPYLDDCKYREYLPSIELMLEGFSEADSVALVIPPALYSTRLPDSETCLLLFLRIPADLEITIVGVTLLRDYYLNFNKDKRQIGVARTIKRLPNKPRLRRAAKNKRFSPSLSVCRYDTLSDQYF